MEYIDPCFKKASDELELEKRDLILPKGTTLLLHGCPIKLMMDTVVSADPKGISFSFNRVEEKNLNSLVKVDITGQLELIKSLNLGIGF